MTTEETNVELPPLEPGQQVTVTVGGPPHPQERQPGFHTTMIVGAAIGIGLIVATFALVGWKWGILLSSALLYEGWTLTNSYPEDTISESIWRLSVRPLIPWVGGFATAWWLCHTNPHPVLILALGFLSGHMWFQRQPKGF